MNKTKKYILYNFIKFVKQELNITLPFKIFISNNRKKFTTYAYYDHENKVVAVYIKNRALADILRSVAHELVHHLQNQRGDIIKGEPIQDIGGKIEDEANSIAGQLVKKFGYQNKNFEIYN